MAAVLQGFITILGNARVGGMATDLHLVGLRYNIAAAVLYVRISSLFLKHGMMMLAQVLYIVAEIPS